MYLSFFVSFVFRSDFSKVWVFVRLDRWMVSWAMDGAMEGGTLSEEVLAGAR